MKSWNMETGKERGKETRKKELSWHLFFRRSCTVFSLWLYVKSLDGKGRILWINETGVQIPLGVLIGRNAGQR